MGNLIRKLNLRYKYKYERLSCYLKYHHYYFHSNKYLKKIEQRSGPEKGQLFLRVEDQVNSFEAGVVGDSLGDNYSFRLGIKFFLIQKLDRANAMQCYVIEPSNDISNSTILSIDDLCTCIHVSVFIRDAI